MYCGYGWAFGLLPSFWLKWMILELRKCKDFANAHSNSSNSASQPEGPRRGSIWRVWSVHCLRLCIYLRPPRWPLFRWLFVSIRWRYPLFRLGQLFFSFRPLSLFSVGSFGASLLHGAKWQHLHVSEINISHAYLWATGCFLSFSTVVHIGATHNRQFRGFTSGGSFGSQRLIGFPEFSSDSFWHNT